ncbi:MAG: hypothetical protein AAGF31_04955, partial [Planctomycetota bacterium]
MRAVRQRSFIECLAAVVCVAVGTTIASAQPAAGPAEPDAFATDLPPAAQGQSPSAQPAPPSAVPEPPTLDPQTLDPQTLEPEAPQPFSPTTPATPAVDLPTSPQLQGGFTVRLARAPKMMGDFFGNNFSPVHGEMFVGRAVQQTTGMNEFRLIDESDPPVVYLGGPSGTLPGSFFEPGPTPPAPDFVDGLESNIPGDFVAVGTTDAVDVFAFASDTSADIPGARVFNIFQEVDMLLPAAGPSDLIGRTRLQDNNSAMPQDRVYFDYSFFHNAALTAGGVEVSRFAPALEKTFFDGMASVEVRVPFGVTLNSNLVAGVAPDTSNYEFGNVVIAPKLLLWSSRELAIASGLGVALPTGDDITVSTTGGVEAIRVDNDAVHLLPYFAMLYRPCGSNAFAHAFLTFDFDANGNATYANVTGAGLESIGTWNDQSLVTLNLAYGQFAYQACSPRQRLQSLAWS